jgi:fatty acid desaturase
MAGAIRTAEVEPSDTLWDDDVLTEGPVYNSPQKKTKVDWYRPELTREELAYFNKKNDFVALVQTVGYLAILLGGAGVSIYSSSHWPWYVTALLVFLNGHTWAFTINAFHELIHDSVFKKKWVNRAFVRVFSFLGWHNHHHFWASHTEHHKYALHPPDDQEVLLPTKVDLSLVWKKHIINFNLPWDTLKGKFRSSRGYIPQDPWTQVILPESDPERRAAYTNWERILLIGHLAIAGTAIASGYWIVLFVFTFPKMFGRWLQHLCNSVQHVGLQDNVPDFRLCCRTIYLNPIVQFLYWHMNYHTEHHMYAAVPCYKLGRLHRRVRHEMPHCPNGLWETWRHIVEIQERQEREPEYQFVAELPQPESQRLSHEDTKRGEGNSRVGNTGGAGLP